MLILTFWNLISFSLVISFNINLKEGVSLSIPILTHDKFLIIFQAICLVLYCVDVIIKFNTSFYHGGEPVIRRKEIVRHYLSTGLVFDILGTVPFWHNVLLDDDNTTYLVFFLFKLYPLQAFFTNINEALLNIEGRLEAIYYLIKLLFKVLTVCHIFACLWHYQAWEDKGMLC